jgi:hypothetical protein
VLNYASNRIAVKLRVPNRRLETVFDQIDGPRHCERSEAIQGPPPLPYDHWIASSLRFSQ